MFVCISFCTWGWSKIIAPPKTSIWSGPQSLSPQSPANVISTCLRWSSSTSLHLYLNWYRTLDCVFVHLWSHGGHNQQLMWSNAIKSGVQQRLTAMKCNLGNWNLIVYNIRALATWWAGGEGLLLELTLGSACYRGCTECKIGASTILHSSYTTINLQVSLQRVFSSLFQPFLPQGRSSFQTFQLELVVLFQFCYFVDLQGVSE